jgi:hypothetical protein
MQSDNPDDRRAFSLEVFHQHQVVDAGVHPVRSGNPTFASFDGLGVY